MEYHTRTELLKYAKGCYAAHAYTPTTESQLTIYAICDSHFCKVSIWKSRLTKDAYIADVHDTSIQFIYSILELEAFRG